MLATRLRTRERLSPQRRKPSPPLSWVDHRTAIGDDHVMSARWPPGYERGYRWIRKVETAIRRLKHPDQGIFVSIINAIELQFDDGADTETLRHLIAALLRFARAVRVEPTSIHLPVDPAEAVDAIAPRRARRTR